MPKLFLYILLLMMVASCTSKKQLTELQRKNSEFEAKIKRLQKDSTQLSFRVDSLRKHLHSAITQKNALEKEKEKEREKESKKGSRLRAEVEHYKQISLFIYNIAKYVNWPTKTEKDVFTIAVIGNDQLSHEIANQFNGKKISNRTVIIKKISSPKEVEEADIYFIGHHKLHHLSHVYKNSKNTRSLVLSDHHYRVDGVHVSFFLEGDSLKFDLNEDEIRKSNIIMSSSLKNFQN